MNIKDLCTQCTSKLTHVSHEIQQITQRVDEKQLLQQQSSTSTSTTTTTTTTTTREFNIINHVKRILDTWDWVGYY
jgi:hypothetical protein